MTFVIILKRVENVDASEFVSEVEVVSLESVRKCLRPEG